MSIGESFSLIECFTKPYKQEYTIKWISSDSFVYFLPLKIIDRFNSITRRKMIEEGEMKSSVLSGLLNGIESFKKISYSSSK